MANLNFKYGLFAGLNSATFTPGTIYVTTDEKALYVDLPNGTSKDTDRIRIGQTIVYDLASDFVKVSEHPEFSPEGFYYVEDANMLLRWKGGNKTVTEDSAGNIIFPEDSGWIQINSTSDIESDITGLLRRVNDLEGLVGTNKDVVANESGNLYEREKAITEKIGAKVDAEMPTLPEGTSVTSTGIYGLIATETARAQSIENEQGRAIAALEDNVGENTDEAKADGSLHARLKYEINRAIAAETAIDEEIGEKVTSEMPVAPVGTTITSTGIYGLIAAETARATEAEKGISANARDIDALETIVSGEDGNGGLVKDVNNLKTTVYGSDGASGLVKTVNDLQTKVGTETLTSGKNISVTINDLSSEVNTHSRQLQGFGNEAGSVKTYVDNAINAKMEAADSMKFMGSISTLDELPDGTGAEGKVEAGWTYIFEDTYTEGTGAEAVTYYAGDMMVANSDQGLDNATYAGTWSHLRTGYWRESQALRVSEVDNIVSLSLTDGTGTAVQSTIQIEGQGVKVTGDSVNNITISLEWGTF